MACAILRTLYVLLYSTRINMTVWPCQQSLLAEVRGCGVSSSCDAGSCVHVYNKHGTGMACYSRYLGCGMSGSRYAVALASSPPPAAMGGALLLQPWGESTVGLLCSL